MGGKSPDPPDLAPAAAGSVESARIAQETAREQLAFAREQAGSNKEILDRVLTSQQAVQDEQLGNARKDRQRFEELYQPIEEDLIKEFQEYDTPERQELERGRAIADVNTQFDAARRNSLQRLESFGVDPSQTRNGALDLGVRVQQAAATAGASNQATRQVEDKGRALRAEALNIGRGYPSNVAGSYGQVLQAGNSQVNNANQTAGTTAGLYGAVGGSLNTAIGGFEGSAGITNAGFQNRAAAQDSANATTAAGIGAAASIAALFLADGGTPAEAFESQPGMIDYGEGDGSGIDDKVPIMASTEEYIIPADVVKAKGVEFFDKLLEKYHTPAEDQRDMTAANNVARGKAINPRRANGGRALPIGSGVPTYA